MKTKEEIISKLNQHRSSSPSKWRDNAEWRRANKSWLRYSQRIAMIMLDRMDELDLTQSCWLKEWVVPSNMYPGY